MVLKAPQKKNVLKSNLWMGCKFTKAFYGDHSTQIRWLGSEMNKRQISPRQERLYKELTRDGDGNMWLSSWVGYMYCRGEQGYAFKNVSKSSFLEVNIGFMLVMILSSLEKKGERFFSDWSQGVHGSAFFTSGGIRNFLKNIRNSAGFRGIPRHFYSKIYPEFCGISRNSVCICLRNSAGN